MYLQSIIFRECRVPTQCHLAAWCSDPPLPILQVPLKTTERRRLDADNLLRGTSVQECFITKDGVKECTDGEMIWELVDPDMTGIPNNFLKGSKGLTGTLKLGAAVKTIGKKAFYKTKLAGLDLSQAASLESIGAKAFLRTRITGTIVTPFNVPTYSKAFPKGVSIVKVSIPGLKECAVAPSGTEPCWELADTDMTDIPDGFLQSNPDLKGTLKLGAAVKTIGDGAFEKTKLTGLDLSNAASLVSIGDFAFSVDGDITGTLVIPANVKTLGIGAFYGTKLKGLDLSNAASLVSIGYYAFQRTDITGTLVIPANVKTIGDGAFAYTKLTGLDLSDAASLVSIGLRAFGYTDITGTLVIPAKVETIGESAFYDTDITGLDLSKAASLVSIGHDAFRNTGIMGTLVIPANVDIGDNPFPPGVTIVKG